MPYPEDLSPLQNRRILVIDDEKAMHEMFTSLFQPGEPETEKQLDSEGNILVSAPKKIYNFDLHFATSGEEGLSLAKALQQQHAPAQLAFVDMKLPKWDGIRTIEELYNFDPRMSFIMVTGFPDRAREAVAERLGAMPLQVFPKPFDFAQLYQSAHGLVKRWNRLHEAF